MSTRNAQGDRSIKKWLCTLNWNRALCKIMFANSERVRSVFVVWKKGMVQKSNRETRLTPERKEWWNEFDVHWIQVQLEFKLIVVWKLMILKVYWVCIMCHGNWTEFEFKINQTMFDDNWMCTELKSKLNWCYIDLNFTRITIRLERMGARKRTMKGDISGGGESTETRTETRHT